MWTRLLRLIRSGLNLYTNPVRFLASVLAVMLIPYLAYIFWGTLIVVALIVSGIYFIYKAISSSKSGQSTYF